MATVIFHRVTVLSIITLHVVMLSAVLACVITVIVVAPTCLLSRNHNYDGWQNVDMNMKKKLKMPLRHEMLNLSPMKPL